jgi:small subunit ribosomal protein S7
MRRPLKKKNETAPDMVYNSEKVAKFINTIMLDGKKNAARKIVYGAFDIIKEKGTQTPIEVFESAIQNIAPQMEVRSRRVGGANYQVPYPVRPERQLALAFRWIVDAARAGKGNAMEIRLAEELLAAHKNEGAAFAKRENMHKMAEANKAFAHFAWGRK